MRTALYARVSTDEQARKFGLDSQLVELRALAAEKGYTLLAGAEYVDDGYSGADVDRPALTRLRDAARAGAFEIVLAHDPDRLSRRLAHIVLLSEEFEKAGVRLEFKTTPREDTPEGQLLLNVKGAVAEYERLKIRERTLRGKREKARRGLIVSGPTAYGYRPDPSRPGRLLVHEEHATVVRMIYRWLVEEQMSSRQIVMELRRLGIRPARGQKWAKSSVRNVLTNPIYAGQAYFNRRQRVPSPLTGRKGTGRRFRPENEWITVSVPPILPVGFFEQAQAQLTRNRPLLVGRPSPRVYLLRGLLKCGFCSRAFVANISHGRPEYRCSGRDRLQGDERCRAKALGVEKVEEFIWETIVGVLKRPQVLSERLDAYRVRLGARDVEVRSEIEHFSRQLAQANRQESRLLDLYVAEELEVPGLRARLEDLKRQKAGLEERIARARQRMASHEAETARGEAIRRFCRQALRGLGKLAPESRQRLLRILVDRIMVRADAFEIHGILPTHFEPPRTAGNRADSQHVVGAGGGDLEAALGVRLAPHVGEIEAVALARPGGPA
jgi:site-specific DNA recombinase